MTPLIELLPLELLHRICNHLDNVLNFALSSKQCFTVAKNVLYSEIRILHSTPEALQKDAQRLTHRLSSAASFHSVRSMSLERAYHPSAGVSTMSRPTMENLNARWMYPHVIAGFYTPEEQLNREWKPVAVLITQLPCLAELRYTCIPQLAPCVLEAIEAKASCRLLLGTFRLRSLIQSPSDPIKPSPYEIRLATSPCLHSIISSRYEYITDWGKLDFIEHAVLAMASGVSPRLREVSLCYQIGGSSIEGNRAADMPHPVWAGTELGTLPSSSSESGAEKRKVKGALHFLELCGKWICDVEHLFDWARCTDFSQLQTLKVRQNVGTDILRWLLGTDLRSLRSLMLHISTGQNYQDDDYDRDEDIAEASRLLIELSTVLPPLDALELGGQCDHDTIRQVLDVQGTSVRKLSAFTSVESPHVACDPIDPQSALWSCPALEDLSMMVFRTHGDVNEVRQYEWLGKNFPGLRRLSLLVDCNDLGPLVEKYDHRTSGIENPLIFRRHNGKTYNLQHLLRNCAIDSTLAEAIFRKISSSKQQQGSSRLERLELRVFHGHNSLYPPGVSILLKHVLGRDWVCTWNPRDDQPDSVVTKRLFAPTPEQNDSDPTDVSRMGDGPMRLFHSIWPQQPGQDWKDSWHSLPLEDC